MPLLRGRALITHASPSALSSVHRSVQALEKDIRNWIAAWNTDPKPYIWTKTADEILERLGLISEQNSWLRRLAEPGGPGPGFRSQYGMWKAAVPSLGFPLVRPVRAVRELMEAT